MPSTLPLLAAVVLAAAALPGCAITDGLAVGSRAPELAVDEWVQTPDGRPLDLAALRGRDVFVEFWSSHCPACRAEVPEIARLDRTYGPRGLVVVGVHVPMDERDHTSAAEVRAFARSHGISYAIGLDTSGASAWDYDYSFLPHAALVGPDGRITWSGSLAVYDAEDAIRRALAGTPSSAPRAAATACDEAHICRVGTR